MADLTITRVNLEQAPKTLPPNGPVFTFASPSKAPPKFATLTPQFPSILAQEKSPPPEKSLREKPRTSKLNCEQKCWTDEYGNVICGWVCR
jgi:hypothetical protein